MGIYFKIPSFRLVILEWEGMGNLHWVSLLRLMTENGSTMSTMPKFALIIKVFIIDITTELQIFWKLKSDTCKQSQAATYISVCIYIRYMYINAYMHVSYTYNAYTHSLQSSSAVTAGSSGTGVARWRQPGRWSSMTFVHQSHRVKSEIWNEKILLTLIYWKESTQKRQKKLEIDSFLLKECDFIVWKKNLNETETETETSYQGPPTYSRTCSPGVRTRTDEPRKKTKKTTLLSVESWLFNRDPDNIYNGLS